MVRKDRKEVQGSYLDQFCDFTAMEGFRFLHSRNAMVFRLIALLMMATCMSLFSYQTVDRLSNYIRSPVVINVEQLEEKQMTFPNLILCDESQYRVITKDSVSPELGLLLRRIFTESREIPEVDHLASVLNRLKIVTSKLANFKDQSGLHNHTNTTTVFDELERLGNEIANILPDTSRLLMTRDIKPFLDFSDFSDYNFSAHVDFNLFKDSQLLWDSCLRAQTLGREKRGVPGSRKFVEKVSSTLETALCRARKAEDTIDQILHLDLSSYFMSLEHDQRDLIINCNWLSMPCKIDKVWTTRGTCFQISSPSSKVASSRVVGQSSAIHLLIDTFAFEGDPVVNLFLRPSTMKEFSLTAGDLQLQAGSREKFAINQVTKIHRHQSRCGRMKVPGFSTYDQGVCHWDHKQRAIEALCNCSWYFGTTKPSERSFNMSDTSCNFTQHHGCASFIDQVDHDCPRNCEDEQYEIDRAIIPLLTSSYISQLPSNWTALTAQKLDKFVKAARRTGLTSYASGILLNSIEEFFEFHIKLIRLFYVQHHLDHKGRIRDTKVNIPLRFLHDDEKDDNLLGLQHLSTYLSQQPTLPCLIDQHRASKPTLHAHLVMLAWSKPIKTYQKWLKAEIFTHPDCLSGHVCSIDRTSDDMNIATSVVVNATSINIADFARYYSVARNMNRLQKMIDQVSVQLSAALKSIDEEANKQSLHSLSDKTDKANENGQMLASKTEIRACLNAKRNMISALLTSSVLTSSISNEDKSLWFTEFEDLIQLDESKAYLPGRNYDKSNLVEVTVFFRSLTIQSITQTTSYTIWMLLSEIGGTMGMYLGATVITSFELILFVCNLRRKDAANWETQRRRRLRRRRVSIPPRAPGSIISLVHRNPTSSNNNMKFSSSPLELEEHQAMI